MEEKRKVFASDVPMKLVNNDELYELLNTPQSKPVLCTIEKSKPQQKFVRNTCKTFISGKVTKRKVRTVQEIRKEYEDYVNENLQSDLEKQHLYIFEKIRRGSLRENSVIQMGKKLLHSGGPFKKSTWQMLTNLNFNNYKFSKQYILHNNDEIVVNGSKGGDEKYLCNFDLNINNFKRKNYVSSAPNKRLLKTSVKADFKPGPLVKKQELDHSFQRFTLGSVSPVALPEVNLEIGFTVGVPLDPQIYRFIKNTRTRDGEMSEEWVKFAVSPMSNDESVTFKLDYKNNQKRILMRNDAVQLGNRQIASKICRDEFNYDEVKAVINDLISAVEIKFIEQTLSVFDDDGREICHDDIGECNRDKKIKPHNELKKLDVTIIQLGNNDSSIDTSCKKPFCSLGCVCNSLNCNVHIKNHCGKIQCMLECKCGFRKLNSIEDNVAGYLKSGKTPQNHLAKEERKFHQTVILSENRSIILPTERRTPRMTKKYSDYKDSLNIKSLDVQKVLHVTLPYINCSLVEPWCMVHELYRCFCKGKFITKPEYPKREKIEVNMKCYSENVVLEDYKMEKSELKNEDDENEDEENEDEFIDIENIETCHPFAVHEDNSITNISESGSQSEVSPNSKSTSCARVSVILRKTHSKKNLRKFINQDNSGEKKNSVMSSSSISLDDSSPEISDRVQQKNASKHENIGDSDSVVTLKVREWLNEPNLSQDSKSSFVKQTQKNSLKSNEVQSESETECEVTMSTQKDRKSIQRRNSLSDKFAVWLEKKYISLKEKINAGIKIYLGPPEPNKKILFPWSSTLERYIEGKNFFLVRKSPPHRCVITVNPKLLEFKNYVDINYLTRENVSKMPSFVKQLLSNTKIENNFVLLQGSKSYWEILGIVKKNACGMNKLLNTTYTNVHGGTAINLADVPEKSLITYERSSVKVSEKKQVEKNKPISVQKENITIDRTTVDENTKIGSSVKVSEQKQVEKNKPISVQKENITIDQTTVDENTKIGCAINLDPHQSTCAITDPVSVNSDPNPSQSEEQSSTTTRLKFFDMIVENDFKRLTSKHFSISHNTIVYIAEMALSLNKTLSLRLQKESPASSKFFGMYVKPEPNKLRILIGPYVYDEDLDIVAERETSEIPGSKQTRGTWLYVRNCDTEKNSTLKRKSERFESDRLTKVPKNASAETISHKSYVTDGKIKAKNVVEGMTYKGTMVIEKERKAVTGIKVPRQSSSDEKSRLTETSTKPNKVTVPGEKKLEILRLGSLLKDNSLLKPTDLKHNFEMKNSPELRKTSVIKRVTENKNLNTRKTSLLKSPLHTAVNVSEKQETKNNATKSFVILKPDEINKKVFNEPLVVESKFTSFPPSIKTSNETIIETQIFDYLESNENCHLATVEADNTVVNVLSEDSEACDSSDGEDKELEEKDFVNEVLLVCETIKRLGGLRARINQEGKVSFQFPGFQYSPFYSIKQASVKVNQVLARKIYVPKELALVWRLASLGTRELLPESQIVKGNVLTKFGIIKVAALKQIVQTTETNVRHKLSDDGT